MRPFFAALKFLTVLPVPARWAGGEEALARSAACFPLVGLLIGAAAAGAALALHELLPAAPAAVLVVLLLAGASGGLHLDGLSDAADGFLSARPRERVLEIMRDARAGPMGAAAVAGVLLLKSAALASLGEKEAFWLAALLMPLAGRCALTLAMAVLPYARPEGGLGSVFWRRSRAPAALVGLAVLAGGAGLAARWAGLAAALGALAVALALALWSRRRIGGATGDTLGATCELAEAAVPLVLAAWLRAGGAL